ncbi:hypothetical protein ACERII_13190 [Evansella sp. AB-rgal1]|uniref:hypothetical protein n=1 Tax=Evansella sp. AB-rgal1 TaxID=3242696 RepID=UPI00359D0C8B
MKNKIVLLPVLTFFIISLCFIGYVYFSNPLVFSGGSQYSKDGIEQTVYDFSNNGFMDITLKEVTVNGKKEPKNVALGVSYDTLQGVQVGTDNPNILFMKLDEEKIQRKITSNQALEVINKNEGTPLSYGILVEYYEEPIESLTVTYMYFGLSIKKNMEVFTNN